MKVSEDIQMELKPLELVLSGLEVIERTPDGAKAYCPCHIAERALLIVKEGEDGRVTLKCYGGCSEEKILSKAGLPMSVLFIQDGDRKSDSPVQPQSDATVQPESQYADNIKKNGLQPVINIDTTPRNRATDTTRNSPPGYAVKKSPPKRSPESWKEILSSVATLSESKAEEAEKRKQEAWDQCKDLAQEPQILDLFVGELPHCGLVGEERAGQLIFLAVTSRLFERPISCIVKGPSSAGKSYLVETVLRFFPEPTYYVLSGVSEKVLAYSQEPLSHRILVIYEAAGLKSEFANYLLRNLLSEGCIRYETLVLASQGWQPKLIEREGPTGVILTTTKIELHPENETRFFSIPVNDTSEQTRRIFRSLAEERCEVVDMTSWHALQRWLEIGERRVIIPYAQALAEHTAAVAVRLRRDFGAVLTLIRTHALLHQATRDRDTEGRIIANLDDYSVVRELVADLIGERVEVVVSKETRETVEAVRNYLRKSKKSTAKVKDIAGLLSVDKSTASRRIKKAISEGYLRNLEHRKYLPARLVLGDPLPVDLEVLPLLDLLSG